MVCGPAVLPKSAHRASHGSQSSLDPARQRALVLLSIFAGVFSTRFGAPLLLAFLGLEILAGEEG
jgi:uncharacterized membrane protein